MSLPLFLAPLFQFGGQRGRREFG
ncbi:hypothetical protein Ccrd_015506 [Cynara cardunculus var. scolymus]|uniref:Uncharacterized protein n=1 Tax=Cynara cardunculus var. scolymus TaxID=59895 RepID=A0A103YBR5_CYNCS|nr:hypothetical protein Ccrd_015506 [Cynara cardunculus var. scolymus]